MKFFGVELGRKKDPVVDNAVKNFECATTALHNEITELRTLIRQAEKREHGEQVVDIDCGERTIPQLVHPMRRASDQR